MFQDTYLRACFPRCVNGAKSLGERNPIILQGSNFKVEGTNCETKKGT
jgi:hypothetical protein